MATKAKKRGDLVVVAARLNERRKAEPAALADDVVRITIVAPAALRSELARLAIARRDKRGGSGHASVSQLIVEVLEKEMPKLRRELG